MATIYLAVSLLLLALHLLALTQCFARWLPAALARAVGIFLLVVPLFVLEHWRGLGSLERFLPLTTALAGMMLWRQRASLVSSATRESEAWFWGIFFYALMWRWAAPHLDGTTEKLTNLSFIVNYLPGATLPPPDAWFAGDYRFDFYYGLQHYAAALLGRLFGWSPGLVMNVAQPLLIALIGSVALFAISAWVRSRWIQGLLVFSLIAGGNGVTPLLLVTGAGAALSTTEPFWAATRFAGVYDQRWFEGAMREWWPASSQDLPIETISFYSLIGDYHPPLGGFLLLVLALALMAWWCSPDRPAESAGKTWIAALLVATPFWALLTNAWVAPLQALLVLAFMITRFWVDGLRAWPWRATALSGFFSLLICLPALLAFSPTAAPITVSSVPAWASTPWPTLLALHWPLLLLGIAAIVVSLREPLVGVFAVIALAVVGFAETWFFDDGGTGPYLRFNTVIKWWSWTLPLLLVGIAPLVYRLGGRWGRAVVILTALLLSTNIVAITRHAAQGEHLQAGRLHGDGWLRSDRSQAAMLDYLRERPRGLVLESMQGGAYTATSAYGLLSNKPLVLGWASHETLWRGASAPVWDRYNDINDFYAGARETSPAWLDSLNVRYILWTPQDHARYPAVREVIDRQLAGRYRFRVFERSGDRQIGLWERIN